MTWTKPWANANQYSYSNVYTQEQIDLLLNSGIWQTPVRTFIELKNFYHTPIKGWIVPISEPQLIYHYDGTTWIPLYGDITAMRSITTVAKGLMRYTDPKKIEGLETQVHDVIYDAPESLDTFKEIAASLGNDPNFISTINNKIDDKFDKQTSCAKKPITNTCLYYGYPSSFSGDWVNEECARLFAKYDIVVWGDHYQKNTHIDYNNAVEIAASMMKKNPKMEFLGYIPIGMDGSVESNLPMEEIKIRVNEWKIMGCTGIFLDEFGYDYLVTRERQNEIVQYIHLLGMNVMANSWRIDYVFSSKNIYLDWLDNFDGNPNRLLPAINEKDYVMFENSWYKWDFSNSTTNVTHVSGSNSKNRMYEAINYYQQKQDEYNNMSYYEKFKVKTIALDSLDKNVPQDVREKYYMTGMMASIVMNVDSYCMSTDSWGASGKYFIYNQPDFYELYKPYKHHIKSSSKLSTYDDTFIAEIGNNTLELTWKQDNLDPSNPELGVHKVTWNGQLVDSFDFVKGVAKTIFMIDELDRDPVEPLLGQMWLRSDSTLDHSLRIMTRNGIRSIPLIELIDSTSPPIIPENRIITDGLIGYWNAKQGLENDIWLNIAPSTLGSYNSVNTGIVVDELGAKFDGLSSIMIIPYSNPLTDMTIEFFITPNTTGDGQWLFGTNTNNRLIIDSTDYLDFKQNVLGNSVYSYSNNTVLMGSMNHIVIRMQGTQLDMFINGQMSTKVNGGPMNWTNSISLGGYSSSDYKFNGYMHSFKLYNRALTNDEITNNKDIGIEIGL